MSIGVFTILFGLLLILTITGTGVFRRYAINKGVMDIPNHRSSHETPTPRGGGIIAIACILLIWLIANYFQVISLRQSMALFIPGLVVSLVGLADDHNHLPRRWRFISQLLAAMIGIGLLHPMAPLGISQNIHIDVNGWLLPVVVLGVVWLTNLYNFMDGIDGIAGMQAVFVLLGTSLLVSSKSADTAMLMLLVCSPIIGFMIWNFPPAKIFMGDGCSTALGCSFGLIALLLAKNQLLSLWTSGILLSLFITDATWTLLTRILTGQDWHSPHRSHMYQKLTPTKLQHKKTTLIYLGVNILWLLPLAYLCETQEDYRPLVFLLSLTPLLVMCYIMKAGIPDHTKQPTQEIS